MTKNSHECAVSLKFCFSEGLTFYWVGECQINRNASDLPTQPEQAPLYATSLSLRDRHFWDYTLGLVPQQSCGVWTQAVIKGKKKGLCFSYDAEHFSAAVGAFSLDGFHACLHGCVLWIFYLNLFLALHASSLWHNYHLDTSTDAQWALIGLFYPPHLS